MDGWLTIRGSEVFFHGLDYSNGSRPIELVKQHGDVLVVKIPGGKHFSGRGQQASHGASFKVFKLLEDTGNSIYKYEEIVRFDIRSKPIEFNADLASRFLGD